MKEIIATSIFIMSLSILSGTAFANDGYLYLQCDKTNRDAPPDFFRIHEEKESIELRVRGEWDNLCKFKQKNVISDCSISRDKISVFIQTTTSSGEKHSIRAHIIDRISGKYRTNLVLNLDGETIYDHRGICKPGQDNRTPKF